MQSSEQEAAPTNVSQREYTIVRVIAYQKGDIYFACCLDFNLVTQGKTMDGVVDRMKETIQFYVKTELSEGKTLEQIKRSAPAYFHLKFFVILLKMALSIFKDKVGDHCRLMSGKLRLGDFQTFEYPTA